MREGCLPQIADAWYSILQLRSSATALCAACLNTMAPLAAWIDITLVANARFMGLLVPFMRTPALHEGACACLTEIVVKRMDASAKLEHLARLQVGSPPSRACRSRTCGHVRASARSCCHSPSGAARATAPGLTV